MYLRGIETVFPRSSKKLLGSCLMYLRGIETYMPFHLNNGYHLMVPNVPKRNRDDGSINYSNRT